MKLLKNILRVTSQTAPLYPAGHEQVNEDPLATQDPPLLHGFWLQTRRIKRIQSNQKIKIIFSFAYTHSEVFEQD